MMPVLFVSHGAPTVVMETEAPFARALRAFGEHLRPQAIAIVSAHWQTRAPEVRVTGAERPPLIYDFGGFPEAMYRMQYPAPGAPELAREIVDALAGAHAVDGAPKWAAAVDATRGLDHGAWTPLMLAYPAAEIPVVQVSLPTASPTALLAMGRALASFRARDVLIIGSGTVVHNLREIGRGGGAGAGGGAGWAHAFDAWFADAVARHDVDELAEWRVRAPEAARAHPTSEHFDPFLVAMGATSAGEKVTVLHDEMAFGTLSMRTFTIG
jgi:4,5-DOPA dioxygenase extradiol